MRADGRGDRGPPCPASSSTSRWAVAAIPWRWPPRVGQRRGMEHGRRCRRVLGFTPVHQRTTVDCIAVDYARTVDRRRQGIEDALRSTTACACDHQRGPVEPSDQADLLRLAQHRGRLVGLLATVRRQQGPRRDGRQLRLLKLREPRPHQDIRHPDAEPLWPSSALPRPSPTPSFTRPATACAASRSCPKTCSRRSTRLDRHDRRPTFGRRSARSASKSTHGYPPSGTD